MTDMKAIPHEHLLRLSAIPGIGSNKMRALVGYFNSAARIFRASLKELTKVSGIDIKTAENIRNFDGREFARNQLRRLETSGARLITFWDGEYPEALKHIYDPPVLLFVKGGFKKEDSFSIAIVGSRQPSHYGKLVTQKITTELASKGLTIVSGLAYGIDTLAHIHALKSGSRTIAVLGSGVDVIYPYENSRLSEEIISNGALISEYPLGTGPDRVNFPRRNRIICGLSLGIVVVEAGMKSGALITAAMALEQNREVFAVPGNINSPKSFGSNDLIKQGAKVVTSTDDIIEELSPQLARLFKKEERTYPEAVLSEDEKNMLNILSNEPKHVDLIAKTANQTTSKVLAILLSLELKNLVRQLAGKLFVRT